MSDNPELVGLRKSIDAVDDAMLALLNERKRLVGEVALLKQGLNLTVYQPERYQQLLERLQTNAVGMDMEPEEVERVWSVIHTLSVEAQEKVLASSAMIEE